MVAALQPLPPKPSAGVVHFKSVAAFSQFFALFTCDVMRPLPPIPHLCSVRFTGILQCANQLLPCCQPGLKHGIELLQFTQALQLASRVG